MDKTSDNLKELDTPQPDKFHHVTVMKREVVDFVLGREPAPRIIIDATLGGGGHTHAALEAARERGIDLEVIGVDRDPEALNAARARIHAAGLSATLTTVQSNYGELLEVLAARGLIGGVDGLILDAGVSSHQIDTPSRGFSFSADGPLDMRMGEDGATALELIGDVTETELADILHRYGEVRGSRRLASKIKQAYARGELATTKDLAGLCGRPKGRDKIHPATLVFQGLRIAVNDELTALERVVSQLGELLSDAGRVAIISFHSLEDRIVKRGLRTLERGCTCPPGLISCVCGKVPVLKTVGKLHRPSDEEVAANPRARSARLRLAIRRERT